MVKMVLTGLVFVLWTLFSITDARPEAPYNYPNPFLRGTPSAFSQTLGGSTRSQNFGQTSSVQNYNSIPANFKTNQQNYNSIPSTSYGTPILRNTNAGPSLTSSNAAGGIQQVQQAYNDGALPSRSYGTPDLLSSHQAPSNAYIPQPGPTSIQKHIYVHVAPPDVEEERQQRIQQQQISRQKHYKIIFIKAPTYTPPAQYIAQQQALQEEKTLVYVLVKKPEEAPEISAPQVAPATLNRPEVYFIKYKSRSENVHGGQNVQQQGEHLQEENDSVVIESAAGKSSAGGYNQGYNYDRPAGTLN